MPVSPFTSSLAIAAVLAASAVVAQEAKDSSNPLHLRRGSSLVAAEGKGILLFAADAVRLGQEFRRVAHVQRPFGRALEELGIQVDILVHGNVMHVLQAAHHLYILEARHDAVRRLVDGLHPYPTPI